MTSELHLLHDLPAELCNLPAAAIADSVVQSLRRSSMLVVTAPPGAGKSTLLPITIMRGLPEGQGRVLMLEPRRLAALQIARRMAASLGEPVGQTVGYRIRFESRVSRQTRIEVLTEGILTRMLIDDPTLDGVDAVVFDEFHERSLVSDTALALVREVQQLVRPDLRVVVMSATIDATSTCAALGAEHVSCAGRMYPVDVRYSPPTAPDLLWADGSGRGGADLVTDVVVQAVRAALRDHEGDVLVFLPGEAEIRSCATRLDGTCGQTVDVCPLFGALDADAQQRAIAPSPAGRRKVVLATPIAETSLTIEGVRVVIDSGLCRRLVYHPQRGLSQLKTVRISLDMADQRAGRAGRVAPGVCYRLWSLATHHQMESQRQPEILTADLAPMALDVAAWGEADPMRLPWLSPPPTSALAQARSLLSGLGAIDAKGCITSYGRQLSALPCHPRIAALLLSAPGSELAADIAALLDERDIMPATRPGTGGGNTADCDLRTRVALLHSSPHRYERVRRASQQYRQIVARRGVQSPSSIPPSGRGRQQSDDGPDAGALLAAAYPERVAHAVQSGSGRYRLAGGGEAYVDRSDPLTAHDWICIASWDAQSHRIHLAAPLTPADVPALHTERDVVRWSQAEGGIVAQHETRIGGLTVASRPLPLTPELYPDIIETVCDAVSHEGLSLLDWSADAVLALQQRVSTVAVWHPELALPDLAPTAVLSSTRQWLAPALTLADGRPVRTVAQLRALPLADCLWDMLDYEQRAALDRLAPSHISITTRGRDGKPRLLRLRVEYRSGAELPIVRARIGDCFGLAETPRIDGGRRPILLELLSPGFKPVQLTSDLHSFWTNTYYDVRKQLRRRYPKHPWPDDPIGGQ